jgi:hypothetical protein
MLTAPAGATSLFVTVVAHGPADVAEASKEEIKKLPLQLAAL